jgi:hypothetical protein
MTRMPPAPADTLQPVRMALLRRAQAEAERLRADAANDYDRRLTEARSEAERIRVEAERRGHADAEAMTGADVAAAERAGRGAVLAACRQAFEELRAQVERELTVWLAEPAIRAALRVRIIRALGPDTRLEAEGLAGSHAGRRIDVDAGILADQAIHDLGDSIEELWAP